MSTLGTTSSAALPTRAVVMAVSVSAITVSA